MMKTLAAGLLAATALTGIAQAQNFVALTADNHLVTFDAASRRAMAPVRVTGAEGRLVGIDQRPANGMLYGLTDGGQIVTLDARSGRATKVSQLSERFESGGRTIVDFNPVADRLRVMGMSGQNLRVNVETGAAVRDGEVKHGPGELAGTRPSVTAGAYTNSFAGTTATTLFTLDTMLANLNVQNPPNDGVQAPRARLSMAVPPGPGFDILSTGMDMNQGFLLAGGALHMINLMDGKIETAGPVANLPSAEIIDLAAMR